MKKYIVSDLHGDGEVYSSIMSYLENVSLDYGEVTLYINGDLIDRGVDSVRMLLDVLERTRGGKIKIEYLAGNHELMMLREYPILENHSIWCQNGGMVTSRGMDLLDDDTKKDIMQFMSNLDLYHLFEEKLGGKNIVLVHAKCPSVAYFKCPIKLKDVGEFKTMLWYRKESYLDDPVGNSKYFTIIGHTPVSDKFGYRYNKDENYINIDGGCSPHILGYENFDHVPLVEIDGSNGLRILTFNNSNEIIAGNYFSEGKSRPILDIDKYRKYLNPEAKMKKMLYEKL